MDWFNQLNPNLQFAIFSAVKVLAVLFLALLPMVAYSVLAERKIAAWIQDRVGPNRVALPLISGIPILGRFLTRLGIWQPIADGVKSFLKEDFTPDHVRKSGDAMPSLCHAPAATKSRDEQTDRLCWQRG